MFSVIVHIIICIMTLGVATCMASIVTLRSFFAWENEFRRFRLVLQKSCSNAQIIEKAMKSIKQTLVFVTILVIILVVVVFAYGYFFRFVTMSAVALFVLITMMDCGIPILLIVGVTKTTVECLRNGSRTDIEKLKNQLEQDEVSINFIETNDLRTAGKGFD